MADNLITNRIVAALSDGPKTRRELLKDTFNFEIPGPELDAAFAALCGAGKARRYTNWPMYGGERVEYWALTPSGR